MRRVGLRIAQEQLSLIAIDDDGTVVASAQESRRGVENALSRALRAIPRRWRADPLSLVVDASEALVPQRLQPLVLVRVAPRAPLDASTTLATDPSVHVAHVAGGHASTGIALAQLDEDAVRDAAAAIPDGASVAVAAVGALVNAAHERRVIDILTDQSVASDIVGASSFFASAIRDRESSALLHLRLLAVAGALVEDVSTTVLDLAPHARLYCTVNEGGALPLSRLSSDPVHAVAANRASELIGAAWISGAREGRIVVVRKDAVVVGELVDGLPSLGPRPVVDAERLGSIGVHVEPLSDARLSGYADAPTVVQAGPNAASLVGFGLTPVCSTDHDLVAMGAAVGPLSVLRQALVTMRTPDQMRRTMAETRAVLTARLVGFGAAEASVRIVEERIVSTTYADAGIARIRVRAVADLDAVFAADSEAVRWS